MRSTESGTTWAQQGSFVDASESLKCRESAYEKITRDCLVGQISTSALASFRDWIHFLGDNAVTGTISLGRVVKLHSGWQLLGGRVFHASRDPDVKNARLMLGTTQDKDEKVAESLSQIY